MLFIVHVGVVASMVFFGSPGKKWLVQKQQKRVGRAKLQEDKEKESMGVLGLPENPEEDLVELRKELLEKRNEMRRNSMAKEKEKEKQKSK